MKLKKTPRYLALSVLTAGASLIIGFLSFGGMFALMPVLPVALTAFGLSVAYEGEIYLQNISGAWNKLFKHKHQERELAKDYLLEKMTKTDSAKHPEFFKDYQIQLDLLHQFGHKRLKKGSALRKKQVEKTLRDMEKWFALQLFPKKKEDPATLSAYETNLRLWLKDNQQEGQLKRLIKQRRAFHAAKAFSVLAGLFMGLGTTYLLVEAFSVIPMFATIPFAALPLLIIPMAIIAGSAYAMLTYNAVTDMIANSTLRKWYDKIRDNVAGPVSFRKVFITAMTILLVTLAIALTICTAGTWWTVAKKARPLFAWMGKMPSFIMGVINPVVTGSSALVFNLQNTGESLTLIDNATKKPGNIFKRSFKSIADAFHSLRKHEHVLQMLNPFRLVLKLTIMPLRILLFLGHLIGIGVTSDRVPGIPESMSALFGIFSEGFEDMHYFVGHEHEHEEHVHAHEEHVHAHDEHEHAHDEHEHAHDEHEHNHEHGHCKHNEKNPKHELLKERLSKGCGHNHDLDLPTRILKFIFSPVYFLAAVWDYFASKMGNKPLSFKDAWEKQTGLKKAVSIPLPSAAQQPSQGWKGSHADYCIKRFTEKHFSDPMINKAVAKEKVSVLTKLQKTLRDNPEDIEKQLDTTKKLNIINKARFFNSKGPTETRAFLDKLPERITPRVRMSS